MFLYKKKDEVSKWKFAAIDVEETVSQLTYSQEEQSWHATECTFQEVGDPVAWYVSEKEEKTTFYTVLLFYSFIYVV